MSSPRPKFEKQSHHVVPKGWQRRFFGADVSGTRNTAGYYRDVIAGRDYGPVGPGDKMAEDYAYIVFDEFFRPSDELEDRIACTENTVLPAIDRIASSGRIEPFDRVDVARLLGLQVTRYPEHFSRRLDMAKYLAIAIDHAGHFRNAEAFNKWLSGSGMLPGASLTDQDFEDLKTSNAAARQLTVDRLLEAQGYEAYFNPSLVLSAAEPIAHHIAALRWELLEAPAPAFILSDRPLPPIQLGYSFDVAISDRFALRMSNPPQPVAINTVVTSVPASQLDIDTVNSAMRNRAKRWICGAGSWVYNF